MQLSRFSDLALRSLMLLAVAHEKGDHLTSAQVARAVNASIGHVQKTISRLVNSGLIKSRRGRNGGLSITEAGLKASVGRVLRDLEGEAEVVECEGTQPCPLAQGCRLRVAFGAAREAFFATLDPLTVVDMVENPTREFLLTASPPMPGESSTSDPAPGSSSPPR